MKLPAVLLIAFLAFQAHSQDYMVTIANKSCECIPRILETVSNEQFNLELGLCMIDAATPFKAEILKDHAIDLDNIANDGTKLGQIIGLRMATTCPDALMKVSQRMKAVTKESKPDVSIHGTITKIENELFVVVTLKDDGGKSNKFYWLTPVESEWDLANIYKSLSGKSVTLTYEERSLFDPKISEYRSFHIIKKINP